MYEIYKYLYLKWYVCKLLFLKKLLFFIFYQKKMEDATPIKEYPALCRKVFAVNFET